MYTNHQLAFKGSSVSYEAVMYSGLEGVTAILQLDSVSYLRVVSIQILMSRDSYDHLTTGGLWAHLIH